MNIAVGVIIFITGVFAGFFIDVLLYSISKKKPIFRVFLSCSKNKSKTHKYEIRKYSMSMLIAFVWISLYLKYDLTVFFIISIYLMFVLICVFFIDIKLMVIPDKLVFFALLGGLAAFISNLLEPLSIYNNPNWYFPLLGMVSASGILFVIAVIGLIVYKTDKAMGMGDVKIFLPIGLCLGPRLALLTLILSIFFSGIFGLFLVIFRKKDMKSHIAFAPFIVLATYIVLLFGDNMLV